VGITYTTAWAQKEVKTFEKWQSWVASLKDGDRVLFQQFMPRGNFCLDPQAECWRFVEARFLGDKIVEDYEPHPVKNGYAVYWNSDSKWGDVFDARIVPWHGDVAPLDGTNFRDCHAPVFDETWSDRGCHRVLALIDRKHRNAFESIKEQFLRCYEREVAEGNLVTIFGDWEEVSEDKINAIAGAKYLYSEPLHN
jgi:hypothetical protein